MITPEEEKYILRYAYVPEHIVGLMTRVSGGEPFFLDNYFFCRRNRWIILVGYPLKKKFNEKDFQSMLHGITQRFRPQNISLIAPRLPQTTALSCTENERDHYYTLEIRSVYLKPGVKRIIRKAEKHLVVDVSGKMAESHAELSDEFIQRVEPPMRVRNLLFKLPAYVDHSKSAMVLSAWDKSNQLAAFYIVDMAAADFSAYVMGCHSKKNYTLGASDLLFRELIRLSREHGKKYIHLGLGINKGIRQFKEKWGGVPTRKYEMCELILKKPSLLEAFTVLTKRE